MMNFHTEMIEKAKAAKTAEEFYEIAKAEGAKQRAFGKPPERPDTLFVLLGAHLDLIVCADIIVKRQDRRFGVIAEGVGNALPIVIVQNRACGEPLDRKVGGIIHQAVVRGFGDAVVRAAPDRLYKFRENRLARCAKGFDARAHGGRIGDRLFAVAAKQTKGEKPVKKTAKVDTASAVI